MRRAYCGANLNTLRDDEKTNNIGLRALLKLPLLPAHLLAPPRTSSASSSSSSSSSSFPAGSQNPFAAKLNPFTFSLIGSIFASATDQPWLYFWMTGFMSTINQVRKRRAYTTPVCTRTPTVASASLYCRVL